MHEATILQNILEIVEENARTLQLNNVYEIELEIGVLSDVSIEALEFAMQCVEKKNLLKNTKLKIKQISGKAKCNLCKNEFEISDYISLCPYCSSMNFEIISGKELKIISIKGD